MEVTHTAHETTDPGYHPEKPVELAVGDLDRIPRPGYDAAEQEASSAGT